MRNELKQSFENMHKRSLESFLRYPDELVGAYFATHNWNSVLDFGCSNGRHTQMLCDLAKENTKKNPNRIKETKIWALDLNEKVLEIVKQRAPDAQTLLGDEISLIPNNSLDCVLCWGVLYMNNEEEQRKILNNFYDLLKDNGEIVISYRSINDSHFIENKVSINIWGVEIRAYSFEEIQSLLDICGFEITDIKERIDKNLFTKKQDSFYMIVAKKSLKK